MGSELLFVIKTQSSELLTRSSKARERSKIYSHVQANRRIAETKNSTQAWSKYTSTLTVASDESFSNHENRTLATQRLLTRLPHSYPADNASDPFHCTVMAADAGNHAMLYYTFACAAKTTFLAEAFAPPSVATKRASMRHNNVIGERLQRCVEDSTLMSTTLSYSSSCLAWMLGIVEDGRPPEYFLDKAFRAVRLRLAEPDHPIDTWLLLSIYSLAITELWNRIPDIWGRCPERYATISKVTNLGLSACRTHLKALLHIIDRAGGWDKFDPYVMESSILADKFLAINEMQPPVIPLTWDPGPMSNRMRKQLGLRGESLRKLGSKLLKAPISHELRDIIQDIIDYARIAHETWACAIIPCEVESWLFLRLQALTYRLLLLDHGRLQALDNCVCLTTLTFLLNATQYYGAQLSATALLRHLRSSFVMIPFGPDELGDGLQFWSFCTGAMTTEPSPDREWFTMLATQYSHAVLSEMSQEAFSEELESYLFLPVEQKMQLSALVTRSGVVLDDSLVEA